jgi:hypothetical protein
MIFQTNPNKNFLVIIGATFIIAIVSPSGEIIDSFLYSSDLGANGTGNTLQLNNEGIFIPAQPTPGSENYNDAVDENSDTDTNSDDENDQNNNESNNISTHQSQVDLSNYKPNNPLKVSIGRDRAVPINSDVNFYIEHNQAQKKGDEIEHVYKKEGLYNVVLNAKTDNEQAISRTKIRVFEPKAQISLQKSGKSVEIMLKNLGEHELNLGGFYIKHFSGDKFTIPTDTIISANEEIIIKTDLQIKSVLEKIYLHYPNNDVLSETNTDQKMDKIIKILL